MSHKITLEEEKNTAIRYVYNSQEYVRKYTWHGKNQVNRILQPKNLAWLLFHEIKSHQMTKYANKHLQEQVKGGDRAFWIMAFLCLATLAINLFL